MEMETDSERANKGGKTIDAPESPTGLYALVCLAEVLGILCVVLIAAWNAKWMGGYAWDGSSKEFNWHPVFAVIGFIFLNGNGKNFSNEMIYR